jgi:hypothetical protein
MDSNRGWALSQAMSQAERLDEDDITELTLPSETKQSALPPGSIQWRNSLRTEMRGQEFRWVGSRDVGIERVLTRFKAVPYTDTCANIDSA